MGAEAVVLDPHPILHSAIQQLLRSADIKLVAATTSPSRALELLAHYRPELFVIEPLVTDGLACIEQALTADPMLTVVALSGGEGRWWRQETLSRGAAAFVQRSAPITTIEAAVTDALELARCGDETLVSSLTPRERQIVALVAEHRTNAEVAQILWLSQETVKFHLANAFRKLHVANRNEAARWARRHGLIERERSTAELPIPLTAASGTEIARELAGRGSVS